MRDDKESIAIFEPLLVGESSPRLLPIIDLAFELTAKSSALSAQLPDSVALSLSNLIRSMNCYYSNLIEGHNTHPVEIERALAGDYSADPSKRNLQLEAQAHIDVQRWIDEGGLGELHPTAPEAITRIHKKFCEQLPAQLLESVDPLTGEVHKVQPGCFRQSFVQVGRHTSISPGAVPRFLARMHEVYRRLGKTQSLVALSCAHHRLLWIHPFLDGNGRVARLMSGAMLQRDLNTKGLWSVSRGLARKSDEYKAHLAACDAQRHGDMDGRGTLSEKALSDFARFFLSVCIDQVDFISNLMQPSQLGARVLIWIEEQIRGGMLPPKSDIVVKAILYRGSVERAEVETLVGLSDRGARRITSKLLEAGVISSSSIRAPLVLGFPAKYADRWMPGLFPALT